MKLKELLEGWEDADNKAIIDKRDGQYVSFDEEYEIRYFVDAYLKRLDRKLSSENRAIVVNVLMKYDGKIPAKRDDLFNFVDTMADF